MPLVATDLALVATDLAPVALATLLAWTGAVKLFGRSTAQRAAGTSLVILLGGVGRAALALRAVGAVECVIAVALLAAPTVIVPGVAGALLGLGFVGYLGHARITAPRSSCGCTARDDAPITWRSFARAGLVVLAGVASAACAEPWWTAAPRQPMGALAVLAVWAAGLTVLSADMDRWWLLPLRRLRLRLLGHPLGGGSGGEVPVAASVELLEHSLAWHTVSPYVRSALLDHWDDGDLRILQFSGAYARDAETRHLSVLFTLDARATTDSVREPAVRVSLVDEDEGREVTRELLADAGTRARPPLPLVT